MLIRSPRAGTLRARQSSSSPVFGRRQGATAHLSLQISSARLAPNSSCSTRAERLSVHSPFKKPGTARSCRKPGIHSVLRILTMSMCSSPAMIPRVPMRSEPRCKEAFRMSHSWSSCSPPSARSYSRAIWPGPSSASAGSRTGSQTLILAGTARICAMTRSGSCRAVSMSCPTNCTQRSTRSTAETLCSRTRSHLKRSANAGECFSFQASPTNSGRRSPSSSDSSRACRCRSASTRTAKNIWRAARRSCSPSTTLSGKCSWSPIWIWILNQRWLPWICLQWQDPSHLNIWTMQSRSPYIFPSR